MFGNAKKWLVVAGVATLLTGGTLGAVALADTPTPSPAGTQSSAQQTDYRQVFLGKLAGLLGIDQQKLESSIKQAGKDTVDEAVKGGSLTQAQADKAKARIDQGGLGIGGHFGFRHHGGKGMRGRGAFEGPHGAYGKTELQAAADKLGMSITDLQSALRSGKSLSDVAKDKGVSDQDLKTAMVAAAKTQLDQAVTNGKLTQAQEDSILQRIQQSDLSKMHRGKGSRGA